MAEIGQILGETDPERLKACVRALEGVRHGQENPDALEARAVYLERELAAFGLTVESQPVPYGERVYRNIVATHPGSRGGERILVGAHYDGPPGSPGADDNASGVAALLETARILSRVDPPPPVQFAAFTLEEPQTLTHYKIGSARFTEKAKRTGTRIKGALILECVGYADRTPGSQQRHPLVRIPMPETGDFLGVIADRRSVALMKAFERAARGHMPELPVVAYKTPLSGYLVPETRFSDHTSFWDRGYPALLLTDTAMYRNPHYHAPTDTADTLDYAFLAAVTRTVLAALLIIS